MNYLLITNNDRYAQFQAPKTEVQLLNDTGLAVLIAGRDALHKGYQLLNGPLYGNFRPYQQPFRTLLLRRSDQLDLYGLELLEGAIDVYQNCQWPHVTPSNCAPQFVEDYKFIDRELMTETLRGHGLTS